MASYKQTSFSGGMNLLLDDTRLPVSFKYKEGETPYDITYNQYRLGLNIRTRFDVCSAIQSSVVDELAPAGIKQELVSFGNYIILFCNGNAYYHLNGVPGWTQIANFSMDPLTPRYWTKAVPVSLTNYVRQGIPTQTGSTTNTSGSTTITTNTYSTVSNPNLGIKQVNVIAGSFSQLPGLLVQDGINQPWFIFIDEAGNVQARVTQTYAQWSFTLAGDGVTITNDNREYVPIGTYMEWFNGILFIADSNFNYIYRSVSGRPLDFVINVNPDGTKGGDATTTSYSVGVAGITALQAVPGNQLFVAAGGSACFAVTLNTTPNAPTIFGEYTFIRTTLFNSNCVTERGIVEVLGDTVFIDSNGLRSFNAVEQQLNEGRNSVFSNTISALFTGITQSASVKTNDGANFCSACSYDNYAIFSVNTVFGYVLVVYDTITNVYTSLDTLQLGNHAAKAMAVININELACYAITDDDRVVQLYISSSYDPATIRLGAVCSQDPKKELKVSMFRPIFSNITENTTVTCSLFTNNRYDQAYSTNIEYVAPVPYTGTPLGNDIGTQTNSCLFTFPNSQQGWKAFLSLTWTNGASLTTVGTETIDSTPMNPPLTQAVTNSNGV